MSKVCWEARQESLAGMQFRWVTSHVERFAVDATQNPGPSDLKSDVVYRMGCKGRNALEKIGKLYKVARAHQGAVRRRETTSLIWMHPAETAHSLDFENAKTIDHGRFKGREVLHSGPQAGNRCASLPVRCQAISTRVRKNDKFKEGSTYEHTN